MQILEWKLLYKISGADATERDFDVRWPTHNRRIRKSLCVVGKAFQIFEVAFLLRATGFNLKSHFFVLVFKAIGHSAIARRILMNFLCSEGPTWMERTRCTQNRQLSWCYQLLCYFEVCIKRLSVFNFNQYWAFVGPLYQKSQMKMKKMDKQFQEWMNGQRCKSKVSNLIITFEN